MEQPGCRVFWHKGGHCHLAHGAENMENLYLPTATPHILPELLQHLSCPADHADHFSFTG